MEHINNILEAHCGEKSVITIGKFDGIHKGHQKLIHKILEYKRQGYQSIVIGMRSIDPQKQSLLTVEEKRKRLMQMGVDYFIDFPMKPEILSLEPEFFLEHILLNNLNMKHLVIGEDFRFGKDRRGDKIFLQLHQEKGYTLTVLNKVLYKEEPISSTRIRRVLAEGNMEEVEAMLGFFYSFTGEVIHGKKIGRTLSVPTANLSLDPQKILPPQGVYITKMFWQGREYYGVSNLGTKPSIGQSYPIGLETFFFDLEEDLYGQNLEIELLSFRRQEMYFRQLEDLKAQMEQDIVDAKAYLKLRKVRTV